VWETAGAGKLSAFRLILVSLGLAQAAYWGHAGPKSRKLESDSIFLNLQDAAVDFCLRRRKMGLCRPGVRGEKFALRAMKARGTGP